MMRLKDWLGQLEYKLLSGTLEQEVDEVVYDSRKAAPGAVFVCMKGSKVDSHDFIPQVLQAGVLVLVTEKEVQVPETVTVLKVQNGRNALALLSAAKFGYPAREMVTIGVTGTKGKTTTTYMIKTILEQAGKKVGLIGTNGAVIDGQTYLTTNTTPESYQLQSYFRQMVDCGCEYMIMEVSSQGLMMHRVDGIFFDYGIFLNISPDHIGPNEHDNFEEYLNYKSMLLSRCRVGLMNLDEPLYEQVVKGATCELLHFSVCQESAFEADNIHYVSQKAFVGLEFDIKGKLNIRPWVNIPGKFNVYNALAAFAVCSMLGLDEKQLVTGLLQIKVDGRMEIAYADDAITVIVDYAHNAVSMESLLTTLREYHPKRLVCVFGCGGNRSKDRRYSMGEIGGRLADLSIITADNSRFEKVEDILADIKIGLSKTQGQFLEIPDRRQAIAHSMLQAEPGDMIAIIGKGHEDYQEIEGVRYPFLDRKVVEETVAQLGGLT